MRYINIAYGLPFGILVNQWNHDPIAKESMIGAAAFPHIPSLHPCPVGFELHFGAPWCFVSRQGSTENKSFQNCQSRKNPSLRSGIVAETL